MASTTVDRVLNQYDLIDRYSAKLDAISRRTAAFGRQVDRVKSTVLGFGGTALLAGGAGLLAFGKEAVEASVKFELLETTLKSLNRSAERTAQELDFARKLAGPANFTFNQLAEAGTQLEGFNVPFERTLLLIAKLGVAFPNKELQDFVGLFGRLAAGDFPDIEALSGIGLSKLDFMKKGIKFDAQGSLISSSRETMETLEKIINEKYGNILNDVAKTTASKLSSVKDKWEENLRKIGDAIVKILNPALDKLSGFLDKLGKDQGFENFLKSLAKNFVKFVGVIFGVLGSLLIVIALLKFALKDVVGGVVATMGAVAAFAGGAFSVRELTKFFKDLEKSGAAGAGKVEVPGVPPGSDFPNNPALATLNDIEKNTSKTAENTRQLDLRKFALGGGEIGQQGISAIERFRGRGGGGRNNLNLNINPGRGDKMGQAVAEIVRDVVEQLLIKNGGRL